MLICTTSSPLFPINRSHDAGYYFGIGRAMKHGSVLYRDIFDQKGFYIFLPHIIGAILQEQSFIGIYLQEAICCFLSGYILLQIGQLFLTSEKEAFYSTLLSLCVIYGSYYIGAGDEAEEWLIPIFLGMLYSCLRAWKENQIPSNKTCIGIGIGIGILFWTKYTLIGFGIGAIGSFFLLFGKKIIKKWRMFLFGFGIATLPVFLYFGYHHAFLDLIEAYFFANFTYSEVRYAGISELWKNYRSVFALFTYDIPCMIFTISGWFFVFRNKLTKLYLCFFGIGAICAYGGIVGWAYYYIPMSIAACFGSIWMIEQLKECSDKIHLSLRFFVILCGLFLLSLNGTFPVEIPNREELICYQFADKISEYRTEEQDTLLVYQCDEEGFYTATGILPTEKYFITNNLPHYEKLHIAQKEAIEQKRIRYIITANPTQFEGYTQIEEGIGRKGEILYLWQRKDTE